MQLKPRLLLDCSLTPLHGQFKGFHRLLTLLSIAACCYRCGQSLSETNPAFAP